MALGILEPNVEHVPGTVHVYNTEARTAQLLQNDQQLKRNKSGTIILNPQPSDDPNDPLNWPLWHRDLILAVLCIVSVIATTASPLLAATTVTLARLFFITFQEGALLTAYHLAGVAVGGVIFVPTARVWGKRHLFLLGCLLMMASSVWGGSTHRDYNYTSFLWSRVFQGVALAPFEGLVNACVGDLYYVHERGPRMALTNVSLFGGAFLTPVFAGIISANISWEWTFYFLAIFMAIGFLAIFFFVPETAFRRPSYLNTDLLDESAPQTTFIPKSEGAARGSDEAPKYSMAITDAPRPRKTWLQRLSPFDDRKTDEPFWKLLLRPFPLFLHPTIFWACLTQGVIIGWTVMVGVILSLIFLGPPLFWGEERAGKMYTAAFVGSMLGLLISGFYTEVVTKFLIRRNNGQYEPEFRILLIIPTLIFSAIGLYGFGITAANTYKYGWLIPEVFLAFIVASMVMGAIGSAQYVLDAHRDIAVEAFTNLLIFKNIFSFIMAYNAYTWVFSTGIRHLFVTLASIEVAICVLSIPMYVFGKKNRLFFHQHDILKLTGLR